MGSPALQADSLPSELCSNGTKLIGERVPLVLRVKRIRKKKFTWRGWQLSCNLWWVGYGTSSMTRQSLDEYKCGQSKLVRM